MESEGDAIKRGVAAALVVASCSNPKWILARSCNDAKIAALHCFVLPFAFPQRLSSAAPHAIVVVADLFMGRRHDRLFLPKWSITKGVGKLTVELIPS